MKIFNTENNQEKVYVQLEDIILANEIVDKLPKSISKISEKYAEPDELDIELNSFFEFTDDETINFFKNQTWMVDYKKILTIKKSEISEIKEIIAKEIDALRNKYNSMTEKDRNENIDLVNRIKILRYQMRNINQIMHTKEGFYTLDFPSIPNFDGIMIADETYIISEAIVPNTLLFYRKDNNKLDNDTPDDNFLLSAYDLISSSINDDIEYEIKQKAEISYTEDKKYMILGYRKIPKNPKNYRINKVLSTLSNKKEKI